jgi:ADP-heptose:LPS heptosyltransferase
LKRAYPDCHMTMVVFQGFSAVAERLPMVDDVVAFDVDAMAADLDFRRLDLPRVYGRIRDYLRNSALYAVDIVYNLSHTPLSAAFCWLLRAENSYGMWRDDLGQNRIHGEWFQYLFSILHDRNGNPFNLTEIYRNMSPVPYAGERLELLVTDQDRHDAQLLLRQIGFAAKLPYIVLHPGASSLSRQWPPEHFAALSRLLADRGYRVIVTGTAGESELANRVVNLSGGQAVSLAGQTPFGLLAALIENAFRVITNDTGTIHIAAAVKAQAIGIYLGPAAAKDTAPYGDNYWIAEPDLACAPCGYRQECSCPACGRSILPEHVFRLAIAEDSEQAAVASEINNARVYRTRIESDGALSLDLMNHPATGCDLKMLKTNRAFWDSLLNGHHSGKHLAASKANVVPMDGELTFLRDILWSAQSSLTTLYQISLQPDSDRRLQTDLLNYQAVWQAELHRFASNSVRLSSLTHFLFVRLNTVTRRSLEDYLREMADTLIFLEQGLNMVLPLVGSTEKRPLYAAA